LSLESCPQCQTVASAGATGGFFRCERCGTRWPARKRGKNGKNGKARRRASPGSDDDELGIHPALARRYRERGPSSGEAPDGFDTSDDDLPTVQLSPSLLEETQAGQVEGPDTSVDSKPGALRSAAAPHSGSEASAAPPASDASSRAKARVETRPLRPSRTSKAREHGGDTPLQRPTSMRARGADPLPDIPGFEIFEQVGKGAMGRVFKARDLETDEVVALKLLAHELAVRPDFVARFEREAAALARVDHPGVVGTTRSGSHNEEHWFTMEFVEGLSLRRLLDDGPLTPARALAFARQIAQALGAAHTTGVIHRDLKPENILVERHPTSEPGVFDERLVIVDFGLANILAEDGDPHPNLTKSRMTMGTVNYMAPEQRTDAKRVDERADLYALGVIFYELLTGDLPLGRFALPYERGMMLPESVDDCLSKALARDQKERFQTAAELDKALARIETELTQAASEDTLVGGSVLDDLEDDYLSDPGSGVPARRDPEDLSTASGKHVRALERPWFRRPEVAWAGLALALGAGAGLLASGGGDDALVLNAPGLALEDAEDFVSASYARGAAAERWLADADGWTWGEDGVGFVPVEGGAASSSLVAERELTGAKVAVSAQVSASVLPGASGPEGYAGVAMHDGSTTLGVVRFSGGKCGVLNVRAAGQPQVSMFNCGVATGPMELSLSCDVAQAQCTAHADGGFAVRYPARVGRGPWRLSLICADASCAFGGEPGPQ
jgi:serine/threonine protein kinase